MKEVLKTNIVIAARQGKTLSILKYLEWEYLKNKNKILK